MIIDISMLIHKNMVVYKDKDEKKPIFKDSLGSTFETILTFNLHTGTHIDFPLHTVKNGKSSSNHSLETLIGEAKVFDLTHIDNKVTKNDLKLFNIEENDFVLLKTQNSFDEVFNPEFIYISESAANYLVTKKIRGIGIDALGIERNQPKYPSHNIFFNSGVIILEGLRLKDVNKGKYGFYCLPMNIDGVEALPVRAILIQE